MVVTIGNRKTAALLSLAMLLSAGVLESGAQTESRVADEKAATRVKKMTLAERIDVLSGDGLFSTRSMPQYGIPAFLMTDGPLGARLPPPSTAYAAGIGLAATWDQKLAREVGVQLGRDARARGAHFLLGPGVNMYRAPMNGRNFEYFGEDPYLASRVAVQYILGVQSQGVSATVKHLAGNNSEFARTTTNSVIDEHAMRELYLPAFEAAVKEAHVGAVMDSYNLLNGSYTTQNAWLNVDVLRRDWMFDGLLMSDWGATHDGVAAAKAGLDLEMPRGSFMTRKVLGPGIKEGKLSEADINRKVGNLLSLAERFGWLDKPILDLSIPRYNLQGDAVSLQGAEEGMVLLKNDGGFLPLRAERLKRVAVIGPTAFPGAPTAGGSGDVPTFAQSSALTGIAEALRGKSDVTWSRGVPSLSLLSGRTALHPAPGSPMPGVMVEVFDNPRLEGKAKETRPELAIGGGEALSATELGNLFTNLTFPQIAMRFGQKDKNYSRWTGYLSSKVAKAYTFFVENGGSYRLLLDGKVLVDHRELKKTSLWQQDIQLSAGDHKLEYESLAAKDLSPTFFRVGAVPIEEIVDADAVELARSADVVVLSLGFQPEIESEGMDRSFDLPPGQNELVKKILAVNPHVIVALTSGGSVNVMPWIERVPALIETWYPGQEGGRALAKVLLGQVSPSGHLPISWERKLEDNPTLANYYPNDPQHPADVVYREGVFTGYRGFDRSGIAPLFAFGYGLSYTRFAMGHLKVSPVQGGSLTVSFTVQNTGRVKAAAVPQIYIAPPKRLSGEEPLKTLAAFTRVALNPGERRIVSLQIPVRALTHFDTARHAWSAGAGEYRILLGESAAMIRDERVLQLPSPVALPLTAPVATAVVR